VSVGACQKWLKPMSYSVAADWKLAMWPPSGFLAGAAGPLVFALVCAALLQQRIDCQRIARLEEPLLRALHRGWNLSTARPSAICRGSGFQAWP
jgi:hypothetical protein